MKTLSTHATTARTRITLIVCIGMSLLGACARAGQVVVGEIMYHPRGTEVEFIEIVNLTSNRVDIADWRVSGGISLTLPPFREAAADAHFLREYERIILSSADEVATRQAYPGIPQSTRIVGPWSGRLSNSGDTVELRDASGALQCDVSYSDDAPWPVSADGAGHSLVLRHENRDPGDERNWRASRRVGGSPGGAETASASHPLSGMRLNEVYSEGQGRLGWVEIANAGPAMAAGEGVFLADSRDLSRRVPISVPLEPKGLASAPVDFGLSADGEITLFLVAEDLTVLDAAKLAIKTTARAARQRYPLESDEWYLTAEGTRDAPNTPPAQSGVVINEIMFHCPSDHSSGEYVELYNGGASAIDVSGWRFADGITFAFPQGSLLQPGAYVVVARDPAYIERHYDSGLDVRGPFDGNLANGGERLSLEDAHGNLVDQVHYEVGGRWPQATDGQGSSLELMHHEMDNSLPSAWRASDESTKSRLQTFTHTGLYRELRGIGDKVTSSRELILHTVSDAHFVLQDISLKKPGGENLIVTGDVTSHDGTSASGFLCTGTHSQSDTLPRVGASIVGDPGFHLLSTGSGDTKNNKAEVDCPGIEPGDTLTLEFKARWISGLPLLIAQTWDRSFGTVFRLPVPNNLGSPGSRNSKAIASAAPTVELIRHHPVVPKATDAVVVTAKVNLRSGPPAVFLHRRSDNVNNDAVWVVEPMNDDGASGDAVPGDGIYSASVPPQPDGSITQFFVKATADGGAANESPNNGTSNPAMWIVDNSPPSARPGTLVQRFIVSRYDRDALGAAGWSQKFDWDFPRLSNFEFNATAIIGETTFTEGAEVLYNSRLRKGGSPFSRPVTNNLSRLRWKAPGDSRLRNRSKSGVDNDAAGRARFHNRIVRYWLYLFGYPVPDHEFVQQIVNEEAARLGDDVEPTDSDFFERAYGTEGQGELFEIDDAWYMYDQDPTLPGGEEQGVSPSNVSARWALTDWTNSEVPPSPSVHSPIFYHGNWPLRFPEAPYDYASLAAFIAGMASGDASSESWKALVAERLDVERSAIYAAVRGYAGDYDNFTRNRGKNGYLYRRPGDGRFEFHHWDSDLAFTSFTGARGFLGTAGGIGWTNLTTRPWWRQRMNHYLSEIVTKYSKGSPRMSAWLAAMNYQAGSVDSLAPFKTSAYDYPGWFQNREQLAIDFINEIGGSGENANYSRAFSLQTPDGQNVTNPRFAVEGVAPSGVSIVAVEGHPEAIFEWVPDSQNYGRWRLRDVALRSGLNSLLVRAQSRDGAVIGESTLTVVLDGNAPPIIVANRSDSSYNVAVNELFGMDATASYDPEGEALSFLWKVTPEAGVSVGATNSPTLAARFRKAGRYGIEVAVSDTQGNQSVARTEVVVYAESGMHTFGDGSEFSPDESITVQNMASRDNTAGDAWYSLEDSKGSLVIKIEGDTALPLNGGRFPRVHIPLPEQGDWLLQTRAVRASRPEGLYQSGLMVEAMEGDARVQYVFGFDGRSSPTVRKAVGDGPFETLLGVVRINAGGPEVVELDGKLWRQDAYFDGGSEYLQDYTYGYSNSTIHDTARTAASLFGYRIPVPKGLYDVVLRSASAQSVVQSVAMQELLGVNWSVAAGLNTAGKSISWKSVLVEDEGLGFTVRRVSGTSPRAILTSVEILPEIVTMTALRIVRGADFLSFEREASPGHWTQVFLMPFAPTHRALKGGVFAATEYAQSVKMSFEYLLLADPGATSAPIDSLRITEIMYHPETGGVEFIELANTSPSELNIGGVYFGEGQPFATLIMPSVSLAPGEHAVVVADLAAFRRRHGEKARVLGTWSAGVLSNAGERIMLMDGAGGLIHNFRYESNEPWPQAPRGTGVSLEVVDTEGDYNDPRNWLASIRYGGSPGLPNPGKDSDGDGQSDAEEAMFGTDPANAQSFASVTLSTDQSVAATLAWPSQAGFTYRVERSTDLRSWETLTVLVATGSSSSYTVVGDPGQSVNFFRVLAVE